MIKVSVIVLIGLLAAALLRRQSAAIRHWVLASAIACAAATPVLQWVVPAWQIPVSVPWASRLDANPVSTIAAPAARLRDDLATPNAAGAASPYPAVALLSFRSVWLTGVIASLTLLLVGFGRLVWLASRSRPIAHGAWAEAVAALSPWRPVRLLQSDHPTLLVTWGLTRPTVILPRAGRDWPADRIRVVLGHELAHVERRDWAIQMVAELLRCLYWFNPLIWVACRRLRQESEQACDDAVLSMGVEAPEYATHLLDMARALRHALGRRSLFPAPAMARRSHLERRVRAMLNTGLSRAPLTRRAGTWIVLGLLALSVPIAGVAASSSVPPLEPLVAAVGQSATDAPALPGQRSETAAVERRPEATAPASNHRPSAPLPAAAGIRAQNALAAFSGTLIDATGRSIPGVPLALINATTVRRHETLSDEAGRFAIADLQAGEYQVELQKPGFVSKQGRVVLAAGQRLQQDIVAQIGSLAEFVVVSWIGGTPEPGPAVPRRLVAPAASDFDPCSQSTVGGCLTAPRKLVDARPTYPRAHGQNAVSGKVVVEARLGTDGFVKDLRANDGADPDFAASAFDAVRQWQFSPVRLNGVPQECRITVTVQFQADRN